MTFTPGIVPPIDSMAATQKRLWFVVQRGGLVVRKIEGQEKARPPILPSDEDLGALAVMPEMAHYLGMLNDAHAFVIAKDGELPPDFVSRGLRSFVGALDEETFWVAGRAIQLAEWMSIHQYCGRCAVPTERLPEERAFRCPKCEFHYYPQICPAIIVLVRRGDEALLARSTRFPLPMYSTLAGFSEVGETLEATLVREVREETGIEVKNLRYFGSQPWPFPRSLMIGFFAEYAGGELKIDPNELVDAQWFRAEALPQVPPRLSIARALIDAWVQEVTTRSS
jgi:NAD+ diphosphatase